MRDSATWLASQLAQALAIIAATHALCFLLIKFLPDAATVALGLRAGSAEAVKTFSSATQIQTYHAVLVGLIHGDLGLTLDQTAVSSDLGTSLAASLPRFGAAMLIIVLTASGAAFTPTTWVKRCSDACDAAAFLPPFLVPMIAGALLTTEAGSRLPQRAIEGIAILSIALPPTFVLVGQICRLVTEESRRKYAIAFLAAGGSEVGLRAFLRRNLLAAVSPTFEKVLSGALLGLMFTEPLLGVAGFGSLSVRGIRRSDPTLILGVVLVTSSVVVVARTIGKCVRRIYTAS